MNRKFGREKSNLTKRYQKRGSKMTKEEYDHENAKFQKKIDSIRRYRNAIGYTNKGKRQLIGQGMKRTNYKVNKGQYGSLRIDIPSLINKMQLKVFKDGELVYQNRGDKSLVELLIKRFDPKKKYSQEAVQIFRDLNTLTEMPKRTGNAKTKLLKGGRCALVFYNDPDELLQRLQVLV